MSKDKKIGIFSFFRSKNKLVNSILKNKKKKDSVINEKKILNKEDKNRVSLIINQKEKNQKGFISKDVKKTFFFRLKEKLYKTSEKFSKGFKKIFFKQEINNSILDSLEEQLLISDISIKTTNYIIDSIRKNVKKEDWNNSNIVYERLKQTMSFILKKVESPYFLEKIKNPLIILVVGVNGVGKTTTIGKLSVKYKKIGKSVAIVAGDTFRAAALEQLEELGNMYDIPIISSFNSKHKDPSSIVFHAMKIAKTKNIDVLIIDTAGRLQNKLNLMEELKKVVRVIKKNISVSDVFEIILVVDATIGQNAILQVKIFNEFLGVTSLIVSKLDGSTKGGIIFSIAHVFSIPIRYIGVGEKSLDLFVFRSFDFIDMLFKKYKSK
ncbi:Signal recognition particle receptor FtsY [Buchnera aphidicola (Tetraneura ulmi)]|uniref:signal recognition particle-docking protein FtsY n=1 Tax=Buchnera aphidicola TaxID=9 RepID=UPI0034648321